LTKLPPTYEEIDAELSKLVGDYHHRNRPWNPHEDALIAKYYRRVPLTKLAKTLGRTTHSIRSHALDLRGNGIKLDCDPTPSEKKRN